MTSKQRREFTPEFKREAVGLLANSGRTIRQIAGDLDLGISTLNRWKREQRVADPVTTPNPDMTKELARLREENEILRQERDLLKKRRWVQPVSATMQLNLSTGVKKPSVFRGRVLRLRAT
jgi:transposase